MKEWAIQDLNLRLLPREGYVKTGESGKNKGFPLSIDLSFLCVICSFEEANGLKSDKIEKRQNAKFLGSPSGLAAFSP